MTRGILWLVLLGILLAGLVTGPDLWAAAGQSPERQTVPTRTPVPTETPPPEPTKPPSTNPPPVIQATPAPTPDPAKMSTAVLSESLLPDAGGRSIRLHLGAAMIVASILVLRVVRRRA